jgi:hypothetical protein
MKTPMARRWSQKGNDVFVRAYCANVTVNTNTPERFFGGYRRAVIGGHRRFQSLTFASLSGAKQKAPRNGGAFNTTE